MTFFGTTVEIGRKVDDETLDKALRAAAEDLGYKVKVKDQFKKKYRLGSIHEESEYRWTDYCIKGAFLPAMEITTHKGREEDNFTVYTGPFSGYAFPHEVKRYLSAVSEHLGN